MLNKPRLIATLILCNKPNKIQKYKMKKKAGVKTKHHKRPKDHSLPKDNSFYFFISTFSELHDEIKSPLISISDLLVDTLDQTINSTKNNNAVSIRRPKTPLPLTNFQETIPQPIIVSNNNGESWSMRCFCDNPVEQDFMLQCEKCENWQHAKCVNLNRFTVGERYLCPICSHKHIKCRCGENMNYQKPIIKCQKCGYYVHRPCEGLDPGPCNPTKFVCFSCGGSLQSLDDVEVPSRLSLPNPTVTLSKSKIANILNNVNKAPFHSVLSQELSENDITLYRFCEIVYNRYRAFFYLTHPHVSFNTAKKKRGDVSSSFFRALFFVSEQLFGIGSDVVISIFDTLARVDLYIPFGPQKSLASDDNIPIEFSDIAMVELDKIKSIPEVPYYDHSEDIQISKDGVFAKTTLQQEQLICMFSGFLGIINEFCYDSGVKPYQYAITGTKFLIDTSGKDGSCIHCFRRSFSPNCVTRLIKCENGLFIGVFAGVSDANGVDRRSRREKFALVAQTELFLPFDLPPATLEEPTEYMCWHFDDVEFLAEPSSPPPQNNTASQRNPIKYLKIPSDNNEIMRKPKKTKDPNIIKEPKNIKAKRKPGNYKNLNVSDPNETLLFKMFKVPTVSSFLFSVTDNPVNDFDSDGELMDSVSDSSLNFSFLDKMDIEGNCEYPGIIIPDAQKEFYSIMN